jgi:hypothetical protein
MRLRKHSGALFPIVLLALFAVACGGEDSPAPSTSEAPETAATTPDVAPASSAPVTPSDLDQALLFSISKFEMREGKPFPLSELLVLSRSGGEWSASSVEDPESNVFHKAMAYAPPAGDPAILTLGGMAAAVKLWRVGEEGLAPVETLWQKDFGGKFSRMRDAEVADLYGDGMPSIAVATHDQGVFAVIRPNADGSYAVNEMHQEANTFIHEIEIGDLDGDGVLEVYATPSEPNKLDGKPQPGKVVRYVPKTGEGPVEVADLGMRHAKEIYVGDVDGDGRDELYVSVEAAEGGDLEIRRYEGGTDPGAGAVIATLSDPMCRFLTVGDVEGDGQKEMVIAAKDSGLWLARPDSDPNAAWEVSLIDADSKGFEHASLLVDLDGDGRDELYVANDDAKQIRRYVWDGSQLAGETIHSRKSPLPILTWNIMPVALDQVR